MKRTLLLAAAAIVACAAIVLSCKKEVVRVTGVTLDKTTLTLVEGGTETLKATLKPDNAPDKTVKWKSDKPDIADVDANGKVTAKKAGNAIITVTSNDAGKTATCAVTVTAPPPALVITGGGTTQNVGADDKAGAEKVSFSTTGPWTSEIVELVISRADEVPAPPKWISIDPKSGDKAGDYSISITLDPNKAETARRAKITITSGDVSKEIIVTQAGKKGVVPPPVVAVTGVSVSPSTLSLVERQTGTLTATVAPADAANKKVTWDSSNKSVATVGNDGTVTALKAGSTTITVTTEDGKKTASANVTVTSAFVPVTRITLTSPTTVLTNTALKLVATVTPSNATNKTIGWSTSATGATITGGSFTATVAGTYTVTATVRNGKTATSNYKQNFTITVTDPISVKTATLTGVTAPVAATIPSTDITGGEGYTAKLEWDGNPATFGYDTVHTATITLTAAKGYTFIPGTPPSVTLNGQEVTVTPITDTAAALSFAVTFPKTKPAKEVNFGGEGEEERW